MLSCFLGFSPNISVLSPPQIFSVIPCTQLKYSGLASALFRDPKQRGRGHQCYNNCDEITMHMSYASNGLVERGHLATKDSLFCSYTNSHRRKRYVPSHILDVVYIELKVERIEVPPSRRRLDQRLLVHRSHNSGPTSSKGASGETLHKSVVAQLTQIYFVLQVRSRIQHALPNLLETLHCRAHGAQRFLEHRHRQARG